MKQYSVSVGMIFDAESDEDAVLQMVEWISSEAGCAGYRVEREDGTSTFIDAEHAARHESDA